MVEQLKEILEPFEQNGNLHYGEGVTELAHALQAAYLAHEAGESESMIAAALLHDYGHLVHGLGESIAEQGVDANHETVGANALEKCSRLVSLNPFAGMSQPSATCVPLNLDTSTNSLLPQFSVFSYRVGQ